MTSSPMQIRSIAPAPQVTTAMRNPGFRRVYQYAAVVAGRNAGKCRLPSFGSRGGSCSARPKFHRGSSVASTASRRKDPRCPILMAIADSRLAMALCNHIRLNAACDIVRLLRPAAPGFECPYGMEASPLPSPRV